MKKKIIIPLIIIILTVIYIFYCSPTKILLTTGGVTTQIYYDKYFINEKCRYEIYSIQMYNDNHLIPIKITDITAENNNSYLYFVKAINADNIGLISVKDDAMLNNLIRKKSVIFMQLLLKVNHRRK